MIKNLERIYSFFFYLFVFTLPFQVDILVFSQDIYFSGFFNPYLSHFLYLSDLFLLCSFFFLAIFLFFEKKRRCFAIGYSPLFFSLVALGFSFVLSSFFSSNLTNSLIYFIRFFEFFVVYLIFINKLLDTKMVASVFVASIGFQAFLGIYQYLLQESFGLRFIGEPILSSSHLGVAKIDVFSSKFLRIYGTFSHPNIFAGYILFALSLLPLSSFFRRGARIDYLYFLIIFFLVALLLTFSRSAYLAFAISLIVGFLYLHRRGFAPKLLKFAISILLLAFIFGFSKIIFLRLINIDPSSLLERIRYVSISWDMFLANPLGVGAGNFTLVMQDFDVSRLDPWLFQPVHNIFLLILNELGFVGLVSFVFVFISYIRLLSKKALKVKFALLSMVISVIVIGMFDHYFVSLYQGQALFWLMLWMSVL